MNSKKVCFIYCTNDMIQYQESVRYINSLHIPNGFEIEFIAVENATGIAAGYNSAMGSSDAKYKIYLHQDVFIINKNLILDILGLFEANPNLGILGVAGAKYLPENGVWWESKELVGKVYDSHTGKMELLAFNEVYGGYEAVQAIDGLIMITQYDIPWREDLFTGWHFYDVSQCMEFIKAGYEVGVVRQEKPWCIHDSGIANVANGYEENREIFISQYENLLSKNRLPITTTNKSEEAKINFYRLGQNTRFGSNLDIFCPEGIFIGDNVFIQRDSWLMLPFNNFNGSPRIIIGNGCDIGRRCNVSAANKITIGNNVIIAPNVHITDHNHRYNMVGIPIKDQGIDSFENEIVIGDGTWVGINSVIVGNVRIGKGCVIAANTVVKTNIPDYCVAAGNPARIVKMFNRTSGQWERIKDEAFLNELLECREQDPPLISICIPTYNRANNLETCLESIFCQIGDDKNFEVIVSNNASPDHTEQVVLEFQKIYSNLKYSRNETNIGAERNIEQAISKSTGSYILLHGDDDFFKGGTLYKLLNIVNRYRECSLFFINVLNDNKEIKLLSGLKCFLQEASINSTFMSSILFNREEFEKLKEPYKYIGTLINQVYLQYALLSKNPNFCLINDAMFYYPGNSNGGYNYGEVFIKNYIDILNYFDGKGLNKELISLEKKKILDTIFWWYNHILDQGLKLDVSNIEEIFVEYYKDEPYFSDAYQKLQSIKNTYKIR